MFNKILRYIKKNPSIVFIVSIYSAVVFPLCFYNNNYINLVAAEHIDSGSILSSILQLFSTAPNSFYNQNIPYHTVYGYLFNSILFWIFCFFKLIGFSTIQNISLFATVARLFSFITSILIIIETYKLSKKFINHEIFRILVLILVIFFPPFTWYSYLIKSDLLGLYLTFLSIIYMFKYVDNIKITKYIVIANIFGGLSVLCKQPHIIIIAPLIFTFFSTIKGNFRQILNKTCIVYSKSLLIFLSLFFLIHPYAFIQSKQFIEKLMGLTWITALSASTNTQAWFQIYIQDPVLLLFTISSIIFLIFLFFNRNIDKLKAKLIILTVYVFLYVLWITTKIGPQRFDAYFYPIFPFSIILFVYVLEQLFNMFLMKSYIYQKIILVILFLIMSSLVVLSLFKSIPILYAHLNYSYNYKNTPQSNSSLKVSSLKNSNSIKLIYSISLPINDTNFKEAKNSWQFGDSESYINSYQANALFIDLTTYWEKPYTYWKDIATKNNLYNEEVFIKNLEKDKNIILFY